MDVLELLGWGGEQIEDIRYVAYSYLKEGKYDISIKLFEALISIDPGNEYDIQSLGALYLEKGESLKALNYLDRALEINKNHYPSLLNRAKALIDLGYKKQAIELIKRLMIAKDPSTRKKAEALFLSQS